MNYLAHLALGEGTPAFRIGNLLGDFVAGPLPSLAGRYPPEVVAGIRRHRAIDRFTDRHRLFRCSCARIAPERRRVAGAIIDVSYDHFLSRHWGEFYGISLDELISEVYASLQRHQGFLPVRLARQLPRMVEEDWLGGYGTIEGIGVTFDRMSRRLRRPDLLLGGEEELERSYVRLRQDFKGFFPQLRSYVASLDRQQTCPPVC